MSKHQVSNYIGRVIDQKKQAPIRGAKVTLSYAGSLISVYSDIEGIYRLPIQTYKKDKIEGQLIIEAKGYKTYYSFIQISSRQKDFGDIKLVDFNSNYSAVSRSSINSHSTNYSMNDKTIPVPMIITIMAILFMITMMLFQGLNQRNPSNTIRRDNPMNIYQR